MSGVDPKAFEFALSKIEDGFVFENFACQFLAYVLGYEFIPVGGLKDRGIDGLEHLYYRGDYRRNLYQMSIDKNSKRKLENTIKTVLENKIRFDRLYFVTNQQLTPALRSRVIHESNFSTQNHVLSMTICCRSFFNQQHHAVSYLGGLSKQG